MVAKCDSAVWLEQRIPSNAASTISTVDCRAELTGRGTISCARNRVTALSCLAGFVLGARSHVLRRRQSFLFTVGRQARMRDSEGRRLTECPIFDASNATAIKHTLTVSYTQRPFGVLAYAPSIDGKGACVWELGRERYPGDYQGRARNAGVREGYAVKSIGGVDVATWDFYDIVDLLGDKVLDNSSGKFQATSRGPSENSPVTLPVNIEYVELFPADPILEPTVETEPPTSKCEQPQAFPSVSSLLRYSSGTQVDDEFVHKLIDCQKGHAGETVLSGDDAMSLVRDVTELLKSEQTLNHVHFDNCIVVGDVHGQFFDLLRIFELEGMPSDSNPYLFNGDFVDRGSYSLEVIITLFALKLRFPETVRMNRGNHESADLNLRYGFAAEIRNRYGPAGKQLFDAFSEAFRWLPLAHVLNSQVLVVHGGLPGPDPRLQFKDAGGSGTGYDSSSVDDDGRMGGRKGGGQKLSLLGYNPDNVSLPPRNKELRISDIAALPRGSDPALNDEMLEGLSAEDAEKQRLIVDLLWADPRGKTGYGPSYRVRKGCYIFGPDVTKAFVKNNGLRFMIRSHEVKSGGFQWTHPDCVTVFSAPNYLGHARNKAAVVKLNVNERTGHLEPSFTVFDADGKCEQNVAHAPPVGMNTNYGSY